MNIETKCLHEGYKPGNGDPLALPIYQSTTYNYESTEHIGKLFDLTVEGHMYSRISNPTVAAVEEKIAALEGGVGALCTTSGQAAILISLLNVLSAGDHFISASKIYGGTINLFSVTLKRFGIECTFVDPDLSEEELQKCFKENTKAVYGETLANPALSILDIEKFARVAHENNVPFIIDNTFATPVLCRPCLLYTSLEEVYDLVYKEMKRKNDILEKNLNYIAISIDKLVKIQLESILVSIENLK